MIALGVLVTSGCGTRLSTAQIIRDQGSFESSSAATVPGSGTQSVGAGSSGLTPGSSASQTATTTGSAGAAGSAVATGITNPGSPSATVPGGQAALAQGQPACTKEGSPLKIGQVTTASGLVGQNLGSAIPTLAVWAKYVNASGGLACHPVQVYSEDDGSDPGRSQSEVGDMKQWGAQVLVGDFVPLSMSGFRTGIDQAGLPVVGGDVATTDWWADPLLYPVGTYIDALAYGAAEPWVKQGRKKIAVVYCVESSACPPFNAGIRRYAALYGDQVVYSAQVSITAPDYTAQCQNAKNAGAQVFSMMLDGASIDRIARSCAGVGLTIPFAIHSLGANFDRSDPNVRAMTVTLANSAAPWFLNSTPGLAAFQDAMRTYDPSLVLNSAASSTWASAMILTAAIDQLGPSAQTENLTTAVIRQALAKMHSNTANGMVAPTSFSPSEGPNPKNYCFFPTTFGSNGIFSAPDGAAPQCLPPA